MEEKEIEIIKDINEREKRFISNFVANKLTDKYPDLKFGYFDMFSILYNTPMYVVKDLDTSCKYENSSLYISETNDIFNIDECTIFECIKKIQNKEDESALNRASIQYIVSNILEKTKKEINIYGITINTISDKNYSLITNLIEQITLLISDKSLVQSAICTENDFEHEIDDIFGKNKITENLEKILELENTENKDENEIKEYFYKTQELIYTCYFNKAVEKLKNADDIESIRQQLYMYAKLIFASEKFYEYKAFFNDKVAFLKESEINIKAKYALTVVNRNIFYKLVQKIKRLFNIGKVGEYYN